jgi:xanthine dehydrogenase accessory factor
MMQNFFDTVECWLMQDKDIAIATVVQTWGSAPRGVGAQMAVNLDGEMAGSVSGGCVEGAVVDACFEVIRTGQPQYLHFGVADETAWAVGLSCGGKIDIFVHLLNKHIFNAYRNAWDKKRNLVIATVIQGPDALIAREVVLVDGGEMIGSIESELNKQVLALATEVITNRQPQILTTKEKITIILNSIAPSPNLIIVGGVHIAVVLVSLAKTLGYRTVVIDPRKAFANKVRFNHADEFYPIWPTEAFEKITITESTAITVLTHDPKIDDPALIIALDSPAYYVGALGSRKTQAQRRQRLLTTGLTEKQVARLCAPIGLDLGGQSPEQISLEIIAEIVQVRNA